MQRQQQMNPGSWGIDTLTYHNIKQWLQLTKKHRTLPIKPTHAQNKQFYYTYTFKKFVLRGQFTNKNLPTLGSALQNGLMVLINIYDEGQQTFIGYPLQQKNIHYQFDVQYNLIQLLEPITFAFYISIHPNLAIPYYMVIQLQLVTGNGSVFQIGNVKHPLKNRPKVATQDLQIINGEASVGFLECTIDSPEKMNNLSYLLPPYTIITNDMPVPPCQKLKLLNKVTPLTMAQAYPITLTSLLVTIHNHSLLTQQLYKFRPYPAQQHLSDIQMSIKQYKLIIGYHNSWQFINTIPNQKQKPKQHLQQLSLTPHFQQQLLLNYERPLILDYYNVSGGQLLCVLMLEVEYIYKGINKYQKREKIYIGWSPIIFNTLQTQTYWQLPMLNNHQFPPYQIGNHQLNLTINYKVQNESQALEKILKKNQSHNLQPLEKLVHELKDEVSVGTQYHISSNPKLSKVSNIKTDQSLQNNLQQCMQRLNQIEGYTPLTISGLPTYIPPIKLTRSLDKHTLLQQKLTYHIILNAFLPHPADLSNSHVPRKMTIHLYLFRAMNKVQVCVEKDMLEYGVPVSMHAINGKQICFKIDVDVEDEKQLLDLEKSYLLCQVMDDENYLFYGHGRIHANILFFDDCLHFRLPILSAGRQQLGSLLLETTLNYKPLQTKSQSIQSLHPTDIYQQLSQQDRIALRIAQHKQKPTTQLLRKHKQNNHETYAKKLVEQELNNDFETIYEIGVCSYLWIPFKNDNQSENNMFQIQLKGVDWAQLVTDKKQYVRQEDKASTVKRQGKMKFVMDQPHKSHYQVQIRYRQQIDLLLKLTNNQWSEHIPPSTIMKVIILRNTIHMRTYKIKLIYKPPLLSCIQTKYTLIEHKNMPSLTIDPELMEQYGSFIMPLSRNIYYEEKKEEIKVEVFDEKTLDVLVGFYASKNFSHLSHVVLFRVYVLEGYKLRGKVGSNYYVKLPLNQIKQKQHKNRVYRVQASDTELLMTPTDRYSILMQSIDEPTIVLKPQKPAQKEQVVINMINLEGELVKSYLINLTCSLPKACTSHHKIEGYVGEKVRLPFVNPYPIPHEFSIPKQPAWLRFPAAHFSLKPQQQIHLSGQIISQPPKVTNQYIVVDNEEGHVVTVFEVYIYGKLSMDKL